MTARGVLGLSCSGIKVCDVVKSGTSHSCIVSSSRSKKMSTMAIARIPFSLSLIWAAYTISTSPQPPPRSEERVAFDIGPKEISVRLASIKVRRTHGLIYCHVFMVLLCKDMLFIARFSGSGLNICQHLLPSGSLVKACTNAPARFLLTFLQYPRYVDLHWRLGFGHHRNTNSAALLPNYGWNVHIRAECSQSP